MPPDKKRMGGLLDDKQQIKSGELLCTVICLDNIGANIITVHQIPGTDFKTRILIGVEIDDIFVLCSAADHGSLNNPFFAALLHIRHIQIVTHCLMNVFLALVHQIAVTRTDCGFLDCRAAVLFGQAAGRIESEPLCIKALFAEYQCEMVIRFIRSRHLESETPGSVGSDLLGEIGFSAV